MTEIEKRKDFENWKTTKEIAKALGVSSNTIHRFRSDNKQLFEGLVTSSSGEDGKSIGKPILWHPEAIKILGFNISNRPVDQWKKDVVNEFVEKGIVRKKLSPMEMVRESALQIAEMAREIINLHEKDNLLEDKINETKNEISVEVYRLYKRMEITTKTKDTIQQLKKGLIKRELQSREKEKRFIDEDKKKQFLKQLSIYFWKRVHQRYDVDKFSHLTEEQGQDCVQWLMRKDRLLDNNQKKLDFFQSK